MVADREGGLDFGRDMRPFRALPDGQEIETPAVELFMEAVGKRESLSAGPRLEAAGR